MLVGAAWPLLAGGPLFFTSTRPSTADKSRQTICLWRYGLLTTTINSKWLQSESRLIGRDSGIGADIRTGPDEEVSPVMGGIRRPVCFSRGFG